MASLVVVLIILVCAAYQYVKGTFVKAFTAVMITICAGIVAFSYFELLANVFISRDVIVPWAQTVCFVLLFVLAFAILQTIVAQLLHQLIDLGLWPERIGRIVCGVFLGFIISGLLITVFVTAPLANKYPYQRFDATRPDAQKPSKELFNADGFVTEVFGAISSGSLSGKRSFATLHPAFLDQVFLNRHSIADDISIISSSQAIEMPKKKAFWASPEGLRASEDTNELIQPRSGYNLTIVRVGIKKNAIKDAGTFTLSQLRLICKQRSKAKNPLAGKGRNIYPIGYLKTENQLQTKQLNEQINLKSSDFDGRVKWLDFVFYVPQNYLPVLVEFKQNNVALVPPQATGEQSAAPLSIDN